MFAGAAMIFGIKCARVGKVLDTKSGTEFCDQNCHGFLFPHSAAGNMQLFLPMRVVLDLPRQPNVPFRTVAAAMIYTGESYDILLEASETVLCRIPRHAAANLVGFCSPFYTILRSLKRSQQLGPKMGP